jgi:ATP-dependent DNA helicase RecQ
MPKDMESYYQEAGRAGRDGSPAACVVLYSGQDVRTGLWMIENAREVDYPDKETEELLKERDRKRLREMTFYCSTNDCLRGYILKYFGETPPNFCGNCSNCETNFETADITIDAQKILSCVARMKERYGQKMVIDVLRGSKSEKVLRDRETVHMKLSKEKQQSQQIAAQKQPSAKPVDKKLFAVLRELRLAIAKEQNVPAFVIFPDSTLVDMCIKTPATSNEFLNVSGVGQVKLERYGERFLKAIAEFLRDNGEIRADANQRIDAANSAKALPEIEVTEEPVTVSVIADKINCALMESGYDKISSVRINDWLVSKGYMKVISENGKNFKIPTDMGAELGIASEDRVFRGENAKMNLYGKAAQELIVKSVMEIAAFRK